MGDDSAREPPWCLDIATVTAVLDTNVLVRHLTGDPPALAKRATRFLRIADQLAVSDVVLAEVVYVLESFYSVGRQQVAEAIRSVIAFQSISVTDEGMFLRAIEFYETVNVDFADCYVAAQAESGNFQLASFDRGLDRLPVERIEP